MSTHGMDAARWKQLSDHFDQALDLDAHARRRLVERLCAEDADLGQALREMLDADGAETVIDTPMTIDIADLDATSVHEDNAPPGTLLGHWSLQHVLGRGVTGTVYRAQRDDDSGQQAAVKHLQRHWTDSTQSQRFLQERQILARLAHPNIPQLIDHGVDAEGRPWFALEYVQGDTLLQWADTHHLDLRARIDLFRQVCSAVQHAHHHFVVHRDLKPANILVDEEGHAKVLDFGVAKRIDTAGTTKTGAFAGFTPQYAAPEQIANGSITAATDVYALGVVLYELLTGQLPYHFAEDDLRAASQAISSQAPTRMDKALTDGTPEDVTLRMNRRHTSEQAFRRFVRGDLTRIVQTALAKEPGRRYASVQAFSDDLKRFQSGRAVSVMGDTFGYRSRKFVERNRWAVAMGALMLLAVISGVAGMAWQLRETRSQRDAALAESQRNLALREYLVLMFRQAGENSSKADALSARDVLKQGADQIYNRYAKDPRTGVPLAMTMAELYETLNDADGAAPLYERVITWPGATPEQQAKARLGLGTMEYFRSNPKHARQLLDQAQAFWNTDPRRYALQLLESRTLQAQVERAEGELDDSIATLQAALKQRRAMTGERPDRDAAQVEGNLALALMNAGRFQEAQPPAQHAWNEYSRLGLASTPDGLAALNNIAVIAQRLGDYPTAEKAAKQVYDVRKRLYPDSADTAIAELNYATPLAKQGHCDQAIPLLQEALALATSKAGVKSRQTLFIRPALIECAALSGQIDLAATLAEQQITYAKEAGGAPPFLAPGYRSRAYVRAVRGDRAGAKADLDEADRLLAGMGKAGEYGRKAVQEAREKLLR